MNTEVEAYEKRLTTLNGLCEELTAGNFNEFVNDEAATEARGGRGGSCSCAHNDPRFLNVICLLPSHFYTHPPTFSLLPPLSLSTSLSTSPLLFLLLPPPFTRDDARGKRTHGVDAPTRCNGSIRHRRHAALPVTACRVRSVTVAFAQGRVGAVDCACGTVCVGRGGCEATAGRTRGACCYR